MQLCFFLILLGYVLKYLFLGNLREIEIEHLNELLFTRPTITDTLLVMTIFREEIGTKFLSMLAILIFFKIFHSLAQDRVDYIEINPLMTPGSYLRIFLLLIFLLGCDASFLYYTVTNVMGKGPSMMIMFGFEYTLLAISIVSISIKCIINVIDVRHDGGGNWENKGVYVLYLDFITDVLRLCVYALFFMIIFSFYGLPLHIVRQIYITFRSFKRRVTAVIRYRKATQNMDERFPVVSPEEMSRDPTCIVCREDMVNGRRLPCGHILHAHCLRDWLIQQQHCPICTRSVFIEELPGHQANWGAWQAGFAPGNRNNGFVPQFPQFQPAAQFQPPAQFQPAATQFQPATTNTSTQSTHSTQDPTQPVNNAKPNTNFDVQQCIMRIQQLQDLAIQLQAQLFELQDQLTQHAIQTGSNSNSNSNISQEKEKEKKKFQYMKKMKKKKKKIRS